MLRKIAAFVISVTLLTKALVGFDINSYFGEKTPLENGWYYDDVFGYVFPADPPWAYLLAFDRFVAFAGPGESGDTYYFWDQVFGWAFASEDTVPWIYFYDEVADDESELVEQDWYYAYGMENDGVLADQYIRVSSPGRLIRWLEFQVVNRSGLDDSDVYVTLYGGDGAYEKLKPGVSVALSELRSSGGRRWFRLLNNSDDRMVAISYNGKLPREASELTSDLPIRYDKIAVTQYEGRKVILGKGEVSLTSADFFSIPFLLEGLESRGSRLATRAFFKNINTIKTVLSEIAPDALIEKEGTGEFLRFLSPKSAQASADPSMSSAYASMEDYLNFVKNQNVRVTITGTFPGRGLAFDQTDSPASYVYNGVFAPGADRVVLWGKITPHNGHPPYGKLMTVHIDTFNGQPSLAEAIYSGEGYWYVDEEASQADDAYGSIYRDLIAGFSRGYVGGKYGNNSADWWGKPAYAAARPATDPVGAIFYDQYMEGIAQIGQVHGHPLTRRNRGVGLPVGIGVEEVRLTILPDDFLETPVIDESATVRTNDTISISWDAIPNARDYHLTILPLANGKHSFRTTKTSYEFTGLASGSPHFITLKAIGGSDESPPVTVSYKTTGNFVLPKKKPEELPLWFTFNFSSRYAGGKVTFAGQTQAIRPALVNTTFRHMTPKSGTNFYPFILTDASGKVIFESTFLVTFFERGGKLTYFDNYTEGNRLINNRALPTFSDKSFPHFTIPIRLEN